MSELSERARAKAKSKVERLTSANSGAIDASGWKEPTDEHPNVKTGLRPISRRQFKRGGKVAGEAKVHAGRKPRKSGGMTADSFINRNVKEANEERDGTKFTGGLKRGGRTHKMAGGAAHGASCDCGKCSGGRVGKKDGGSLDGTLQGMRPKGGRLARKDGGRAKKGTNINIIIAPGAPKSPDPAPAMAAPGPVGLHQAPPPMPPPGAAPPMGAMPPQMRKSGGRAYPIDSGGGGGLGRLEKARAYG